MEKGKEIAVYYSVNFRAVVRVRDGENIEDSLSNVDIPEGGKHQSQYQKNSFHVYHVEEA